MLISQTGEILPRGKQRMKSWNKLGHDPSALKYQNTNFQKTFFKSFNNKLLPIFCLSVPALLINIQTSTPYIRKKMKRGRAQAFIIM